VHPASSAKMSIAKKQLRPVINSFKELARREKPENPLQNAMGPQAWDLQVGMATQDFENYLTRTVNRILGKLKKGQYAPRSAMNNRPRPFDVAADKKERAKVGTQAAGDIKKTLLP